MKTNFTNNTLRLKLIGLTSFCFFLLSLAANAQKWSGVNGNEWIDYSKTHIRIGIKSKGLHKIPLSLLSEDFKTKAAGNYQLFHRGNAVRIIVNSNEIIFYGEPNDGKSDELLFRPNPQARVNPYVSFFSDEGSYILTYAANPKRMTPGVNGTNISGTPEPYHFQKIIKTYNDQFNYSTVTVVNNPQPLNNSFYEKRNTYVSSTLVGAGYRDEPLNFSNWASAATEKPTLEVMIHSINAGTHNLQFSVGKTTNDADLETVLQTLNFSGIDAGKTSVFEIPSTNLNSNGGILRTKSTVSNDFNAQTYYILTYPQLTRMPDPIVQSIPPANPLIPDLPLFLNFKASSDVAPTPLHVGITNANSEVVVYDISDPHEVQVIDGVFDSGIYHAMVARKQNKELNLLAASPSSVIPVTTDMVTEIELQPTYSYPEVTNKSSAINPSDYDYLIITATSLLEEANNFALYRSSTKGGGYKVAVFEIKSLYGQFNYGEPSPVAIKRYVDYMLTNGIRSKHNLLLIGNSVTTPDIPTVPRLKKEMPGEVPSIGDPGSDFLLVAGIHGLGEDVPAIPVGRISALSGPIAGVLPDPKAVANYLSKVKKYESPKEDISWRKKLIHLDGGKPGDAFTQNYLDPLIPIARALDNEKPIETIGTTGLTSSTRPANITDQVNSGTGMITYYGHGLVSLTQLNIGLISKPNNTSTNYFTSTGGVYANIESNEKFPFIYFNGCGVGNAFSSRNPNTIVLASDWLHAENKGAIAVIASSYNSYPAPTSSYLRLLYSELFGSAESQKKTVGQIMNGIAKNIISGNFNGRVIATADDYDRNNLHIANLFGDPALKVLATSVTPLPVELSFLSGFVDGTEGIRINWKTAWEKDNSHFVLQRSTNAIDFIDIGVMDGKGTISTQSSYSFIDKDPSVGINYYRIGQVDQGTSDDARIYSRIVSVKWNTSELVKISPNPSTSYVDILTDGSYNLQTWKLYNIKGNKVKEGVLRRVSLEHLSPGEYIIKVEMTNKEIYTRKIVKY